MDLKYPPWNSPREFSPENPGSWKMKFYLVGVCLFSGVFAVSFRECKTFEKVQGFPRHPVILPEVNGLCFWYGNLGVQSWHLSSPWSGWKVFGRLGIDRLSSWSNSLTVVSNWGNCLIVEIEWFRFVHDLNVSKENWMEKMALKWKRIWLDCDFVEKQDDSVDYFYLKIGEQTWWKTHQPYASSRTEIEVGCHVRIPLKEKLYAQNIKVYMTGCLRANVHKWVLYDTSRYQPKFHANVWGKSFKQFTIYHTF